MSRTVDEAAIQFLLSEGDEEYPADTIPSGYKSGYSPGVLSGCMGRINIVLASDHPIIRSTLRLILERESEFRVVAEAASGQEAVVLAEYKRPDIVLLDVKAPHMSGIAAARQITLKSQDAGIVFLAEHSDDEYVSQAFKAGARGYVLADCAQSDLIRAIRAVVKGDTFLSPGITSQFPMS